MIGWDVCTEDIRVLDDDGETVLYDGPKWVRCMRMDCLTLLTWAYIEEGVMCPQCGNHKVMPAAKLTEQEKGDILSGKIPLSFFEPELVFGEGEIPPGPVRRSWGVSEHWKAREQRGNMRPIRKL